MRIPMSTAKRQDDADYSSTKLTIEAMFTDAVQTLGGVAYTLGVQSRHLVALI